MHANLAHACQPSLLALIFPLAPAQVRLHLLPPLRPAPARDTSRAPARAGRQRHGAAGVAAAHGACAGAWWRRRVWRHHGLAVYANTSHPMRAPASAPPRALPQSSLPRTPRSCAWPAPPLPHCTPALGTAPSHFILSHLQSLLPGRRASHSYKGVHAPAGQGRGRRGTERAREGWGQGYEASGARQRSERERVGVRRREHQRGLKQWRRAAMRRARAAAVLCLRFATAAAQSTDRRGSCRRGGSHPELGGVAALLHRMPGVALSVHNQVRGLGAACGGWSGAQRGAGRAGGERGRRPRGEGTL